MLTISLILDLRLMVIRSYGHWLERRKSVKLYNIIQQLTLRND